MKTRDWLAVLVGAVIFLVLPLQGKVIALYVVGGCVGLIMLSALLGAAYLFFMYMIDDYNHHGHD